MIFEVLPSVIGLLDSVDLVGSMVVVDGGAEDEGDEDEDDEDKSLDDFDDGDKEDLNRLRWCSCSLMASLWRRANSSRVIRDRGRFRWPVFSSSQ